jgi:hypothetical protein
VLDHGIGAWENQAGMAVIELDQVGRFATRLADLDDYAGPVGMAHDVAVHVQPVADYSMHASTSSSLTRFTPGRTSCPAAAQVLR